MHPRLTSARSFLSDLRRVFGPSRRRIPLLVALMLSATALDLLGVALIAPFLGALVGTGGKQVLSAFPIATASLPVIGAALLAIFGVKAVLTLIVQYRISAFTEAERSRLMAQLLAAYQQLPWESHLSRNSAELVNRVVWYTQACCGGLYSSLLRLVADLLVFAALVSYLLATDPAATIMLSGLLAMVFLLVTWNVRTGIVRATRRSADATGEVIAVTSQALGALREVRLLGRESWFRNRLVDSGARLARAGANQAVFAHLPRQAMEFAMVGFLVGLIWIAYRGGEVSGLVPVLGTFAAAAVRLLPAGTALISNWNNVRANRFALREIADEFEQGGPPAVTGESFESEPAEVFESLSVEDVDFAYERSTTLALKSVSLRIGRGEALGLMGRSGAGKSTLADLVLGLLTPKSGRILVNGWNIVEYPDRWRRMVAYIPQVVFLLDDSLRRNIALGVTDAQIDEARLRTAISGAQLEAFVNGSVAGLDTIVGERGVRMSGGQRQRVAIARALYHDRQFLILDEATSALDAETEAAVVESIAALAGRRTLLVIAHRRSTLARATRIVELHESCIKDVS